MSDFDLEALHAPLQDDAPCGADLEYDAAFLAMQAAGAGKPEQQYGDTVIPAEEPDWPAVRELALALAKRTRDLRVAVWLVRSGARMHGWEAAVGGLQLVQALLERHWAQVHPQLDASDGNDPTARLNALQPLAYESAGLADFRAASLTGQRGGPRVRDVELAFGRADAMPGEVVPSEQGLIEALSAAAAAAPGLGQRLQAGAQALQAITATIDQQAGAASGPDFTPLGRLLKQVGSLGVQLQGVSAPAGADASAGAAAASGVTAVGAPAAISTRDDAVRALQRVCEWIERNEPSNPAPLLIKRAQRLMSKNFLDIIRDLVPDGIREVEKLAGVRNE